MAASVQQTQGSCPTFAAGRWCPKASRCPLAHVRNEHYSALSKRSKVLSAGLPVSNTAVASTSPLPFATNNNIVPDPKPTSAGSHPSKLNLERDKETITPEKPIPVVETPIQVIQQAPALCPVFAAGERCVKASSCPLAHISKQHHNALYNKSATKESEAKVTITTFSSDVISPHAVDNFIVGNDASQELETNTPVSKNPVSGFETLEEKTSTIEDLCPAMTAGNICGQPVKYTTPDVKEAYLTKKLKLSFQKAEVAAKASGISSLSILLNANRNVLKEIPQAVTRNTVSQKESKMSKSKQGNTGPSPTSDESKTYAQVLSGVSRKREKKDKSKLGRESGRASSFGNTCVIVGQRQPITAMPLDGEDSPQQSGKYSILASISKDQLKVSHKPKRSKRLRKFTLFGYLPTELRLKIWQAALEEPYPVFLRHYVSTSRLISWSGSLYEKFVNSQPVPILLHVSRESREVALRNYSLCFETVTCGPRTYYNYAKDDAYLNTHMASEIIPFMDSLSPVDVKNMQQITIKLRDWSLSNRQEFRKRIWRFSSLKKLTLLIGDLPEDDDWSLNPHTSNIIKKDLKKGTNLENPGWKPPKIQLYLLPRLVQHDDGDPTSNTLHQRQRQRNNAWLKPPKAPREIGYLPSGRLRVRATPITSKFW